MGVPLSGDGENPFELETLQYLPKLVEVSDAASSTPYNGSHPK
jgi:hypothetical protein